MQLPKKKYSIIYADPPWEYAKNFSAEHSPKKERRTFRAVSPESLYPTMSFSELAALPIQNITADDCLLFMWIVSSKIKEGINLGEAWGFSFITTGFIWEKSNIIIRAIYTLKSYEICFIFKKGKIPQPANLYSQKEKVLASTNRHSQKPLEVKRRIDSIFPEHRKIELFNRGGKNENELFTDSDFKEFELWDYWGNEITTQPKPAERDLWVLGEERKYRKIRQNKKAEEALEQQQKDYNELII